MKLRSSKLKSNGNRKPSYVIKKPRTNIRRRIRRQISPILFPPMNTVETARDKSYLAEISIDSGNEVSCCSSRVTFQSNTRKRKCCEQKEIEIDEDSPYRRITRSHYKKKESEGKHVHAAELSESCLEYSNLTVDRDAFRKTSRKSKQDTEHVRETHAKEVAESVTKSAVSYVQQNLRSIGENLKEVTSKSIDHNDGTLIASVVESCVNRRSEETQQSYSSQKEVACDESVVDSKPESFKRGFDLLCTENLYYEDVISGNSSDHYILRESSSDIDFSEYTPSLFLYSETEFTDKSDRDSPQPSRTYSLLLQFRQEYWPFDVCLNYKSYAIAHANDLKLPGISKFDDDDDEERYRGLRERERKETAMHDYVHAHRSTTEYGNLVFEQRLQMVQWMVEQSSAKELQEETMFLGVGLLDRFLNKAFFKEKRALQIAGIACLNLAIRIEENQLCNTVRQKQFCVENNAFSRSEVIAMEWLVQEVLDYRCFFPTIYSFLWFYLKAARADAELEKKSKQLAVLALSDHVQLGHWPSTTAAALVILSCLNLNQHNSFQKVIEVHVRTKENDLHKCINSLEWLLDA